MGAFEKLQSYSARGANTTKSVTVESPVSQFFDIKQPEGYFLNSLHNMGYKVVETIYKLNGDEITREYYEALDSKEGTTVENRLTEFAKMLTTSGDMLAVSSAGSGKTTGLIFKIMRDIITGESTKQVKLDDGSIVNTVDSIFVGTFLKTGAEELKKKLAAWQRKMGYYVTADRIQFGTLHAEFKRALNALGAATPIGSPDVISRCLKSAIDDLGIKRDGGSNLTFEDYRTIEGIVAFYRNRLDNEKYNHPSASDYGLTPLFLDSLVSSFAQKRADCGVMDFEDLQELLYKFLYVTPNPAIQDFIANRYSYMYLDEFQDTSQIQYAILKFYLRGRLAINKGDQAEPVDCPSGLFTGNTTRGKIVAIGDDDQSVYRWRGSDVDIIVKNFPNDFKPTIVQLSTNYRCPDNILNPVKTSIIRNSDRYAKELKSSKSGGEFHAYTAATIQTMIMDLMSQIETDSSNGDTVSIICRTNFDGVIPALLLEMDGRYQFSVSSEAMTLGSAMPRSVINCGRLFTERATQHVTNTLKMLADRREQWEVGELVKRLKADASVGKARSVFEVDDEDIAYSCPSIRGIINKMKSCMYNGQGEKVEGGELEALKVLYFYLITDIFDGDSAYCLKMRSYIQAVLYLLNNKKFSSVEDFLETMSECNDKLNARVGKDYRIKIVTVHEYKGKEADCCYIWHDSNNLFPASKTNISIKSDFEEERRVHYIACTRAKKKCIVYALAGQEGVFFKELDCQPEKIRVVQRGSLTAADQNAKFVKKDPLDELLARAIKANE